MKTVKCSEVTDQLRGVSYKKGDVEENPFENSIPVLRAGNIDDESGNIIFEDLYYIAKDAVKEFQVMREGDILIAASSGSIDVVGKAALFKNNQDSTFGAFCKTIRPNKEKIDSNYLFYFFRSESYRRKIKEFAQGANINNIRNEHLDDLIIPLPTLSEQKAIVAKLDRAQRLIDIDRQMLAKYDELIQSVFLEMFGDPVRNPKGWDVKKLGDIVDKLVAGKSFKSTDDDSGEYRVIKTGAVSWNIFNKSESKPLPSDYEPPKEHLIMKGDILISRMNTSELVGASVLVQEEIENYTIPDRIWKIKWKTKNSQTLNYFWQCINHNSFRNEISKIATGTSGSMKNMSKKKMFDMDVILPPLELQKKYDQICNQIQHQKNKANESLKKSEELFSSLVQGVFG